MTAGLTGALLTVLAMLGEDQVAGHVVANLGGVDIESFREDVLHEIPFGPNPNILTAATDHHRTSKRSWGGRSLPVEMKDRQGVDLSCVCAYISLIQCLI